MAIMFFLFRALLMLTFIGFIACYNQTTPKADDTKSKLQFLHHKQAFALRTRGNEVFALYREGAKTKHKAGIRLPSLFRNNIPKKNLSDMLNAVKLLFPETEISDKVINRHKREACTKTGEQGGIVLANCNPEGMQVPTTASKSLIFAKPDTGNLGRPVMNAPPEVQTSLLAKTQLPTSVSLGKISVFLGEFSNATLTFSSTDMISVSSLDNTLRTSTAPGISHPLNILTYTRTLNGPKLTHSQQNSHFPLINTKHPSNGSSPTHLFNGETSSLTFKSETATYTSPRRMSSKAAHGVENFQMSVYATAWDNDMTTTIMATFFTPRSAEHIHSVSTAPSVLRKTFETSLLVLLSKTPTSTVKPPVPTKFSTVDRFTTHNSKPSDIRIKYTVPSAISTRTPTGQGNESDKQIGIRSSTNWASSESASVFTVVTEVATSLLTLSVSSTVVTRKPLAKYSSGADGGFFKGPGGIAVIITVTEIIAVISASLCIYCFASASFCKASTNKDSFKENHDDESVDSSDISPSTSMETLSSSVSRASPGSGNFMTPVESPDFGSV